MSDNGDPGPAGTTLFPCTMAEIALIRRVRQFVRGGDVDEFLFSVAQYAIVEKKSQRVERLDRSLPAAAAV